MQETIFGGPSAVALGSFDGLHRGHAAVISAALSYKTEGLVPCVLLFDRHPQHVITGKAPAELLSPSLRQRELEKIGVQCFTVSFEDVRTMPPREFIENVLVKKMNVKAVCCGYDYRFGHNGAGDVSMLREICRELRLKLTVAAAVDFEGKPVSSTRIRSAIKHGQIEAANAMLGRAFSYDYEVMGGDKLGRLLGAPTINQHFPDGFVVPKSGVYASKAFVDSSWHAAVTNIGKRPTLNKDTLRSETCILDFSGDLYGQNIEVGLLKYLRGERKFESLESLGKQIRLDALAAKNIFTGNG